MTNEPFDAAAAETWEALARYVSGESSAQEASSLRAWLDADPSRHELLATMQQMFDRMYAAPVPVEVESALRRVRTRAGIDAHVIPITALHTRSIWRSPVLRAAAFVAIAAGSVLLWTTLDDGTAPTAVAAQTYRTPIGATDSVRLPDGSVVVLGPSSELVVARGYGETNTRTVSLRGVAMFDVPHDAARPFVVHAGTAIVRDLGTVFTVWHDAPDAIRVVVTSGSVRLQRSAGGDDGITLRAGDRGSVRGATPVAERGTVTPAENAWTRGELAFSSAPLTDVAAELRRWYGIELRVEGAAAAERHLTATFAAHEGVQHVLDIIALALGARVELRGDTALLRLQSSHER